MDSLSARRAGSDQHAIDEGALHEYLLAHLDGFTGPLRLERFSGGRSNPSFKLSTPDAIYVLRAKPGPRAKLLASAHAIEREFRIMAALRGTDVPVPRVCVLCEDESVIGRAFYVMEFVPGRVLWNASLPGMTEGERSMIFDEMNRVIAALHRVDFAAVGLSDFGRPDNYVERQIARWSAQYRASTTESIDAMNRLLDWLPAHIPVAARESPEASIVHGDFRIDNLLFHPREPRVLALLDWELATLGHPLADLSYHCMAWHIAPALFRGIGGLDLASLGIPDERSYVRRYCERTGRPDPDAVMADWDFYLAFNLFRISAILQGIAARERDGTASASAPGSGARVRPLAELGWALAQRTQHRFFN